MKLETSIWFDDFLNWEASPLPIKEQMQDFALNKAIRLSGELRAAIEKHIIEPRFMVSLNETDKCFDVEITFPQPKDDEIEVEIHPSSYDWECPYCGDMNNVDTIRETVECSRCEAVFKIDTNVQHIYS
jgi:hypothetical protein